MSDEQVRNANIAVSLLEGHARNYRQHPPEQIKQLVASLQRFQQVRSIVVKKQTGCDRYTILAGHGLVEAARECYYPELRCDIVPDSWDDLTCSAYLLADNQLSNNAVDDEQLLVELLQEQQDAGFDLMALGTDDETLRQMLEALGDEYIADGEDLMLISDESTAVEMIKTLKFGSYSIPLTDHEFTGLEARLKDYSKEAGSYYGFVEGLLV